LNKPYLDEMMGQFDSKYTLIVVVAKRARQLTYYSTNEPHQKQINPVSVAMREITDGQITWERLA